MGDLTVAPNIGVLFGVWAKAGGAAGDGGDVPLKASWFALQCVMTVS